MKIEQDFEEQIVYQFTEQELNALLMKVYRKFKAETDSILAKPKKPKSPKEPTPEIFDEEEADESSSSISNQIQEVTF